MLLLDWSQNIGSFINFFKVPSIHVDDFLYSFPSQECDYLRSLALPRLHVSTVVDAKTGKVWTLCKIILAYSAFVMILLVSFFIFIHLLCKCVW